MGCGGFKGRRFFCIIWFALASQFAHAGECDARLTALKRGIHKTERAWLAKRISDEEADLRSEMLLTQVRTYLRQAGVRYRSRIVDEGEAIQILPHAEGAPLNQFAERVFTQTGVKLIFSPELLRDAGADASFLPGVPAITMSIDDVLSLEPGNATLHELVHVFLAMRANSGQDYLLLGEIDHPTVNDRGRTFEYYAEGFFIEELITYSVELSFLAKKLQTKTKDSRDLREKFVASAQVVRGLNQRLLNVVRKAKQALRDDQNSVTHTKPGWVEIQFGSTSASKLTLPESRVMTRLNELEALCLDLRPRFQKIVRQRRNLEESTQLILERLGFASIENRILKNLF